MRMLLLLGWLIIGDTLYIVECPPSPPHEISATALRSLDL